MAFRLNKFVFRTKFLFLQKKEAKLECKMKSESSFFSRLPSTRKERKKKS